MKVNGIELLQMIKDGKIKTNAKINVWSIIGDLAGKITTIEYNGCDLRWKPGMFNTCYLYKDNYYFEIIEEEKEIKQIEKSYKIFDFNKESFEAMKEMLQDLYSKQVEIIDEVNKLKKEGK